MRRRRYALAVMAPGADENADTDGQLVQRAVAGDQAAFAQLYARHAPRVYATCMRLCTDPHEAGEATQDAFVRAWERLASFRGESAFGSWVHRIAVNAALERQRADRRRRARVTSAPLLTLVAFADSGVRLDERLDLDTALQRLAPLARTVFVLREIEGHPYAELSEMLGMSEVALRAQLSRARAALIRWLATAPVAPRSDGDDTAPERHA